MSQLVFNAKDQAIICRAEVFGKNHSLTLKMIVDTGSTYTIVPKNVLSVLGKFRIDRIVEITTGSGIERVQLITVPTFKALGFAVHHFPLIIHDLPPRSPIEGLLGLNFLKKAKVIIDFQRNRITLS